MSTNGQAHGQGTPSTGTQAHGAYDRDVDWQTSSEILAQARWLFEQHEGRSASAQRAAATVTATTGALAALLPKVLPPDPAWWHLALLGTVALAAVITITACIVVLLPRNREKGLPKVEALRQFAHRHDTDQGVPLPPSQFAVEMLNAKDLSQQGNPLEHAATDANTRMTWLSCAYIAFAATFILTIVLTTLTAIVQ